MSRMRGTARFVIGRSVGLSGSLGPRIISIMASPSIALVVGLALSGPGR